MSYQGRLEVNDNASFRIMLIKYVRNVTGCGLYEAKEFVEGTYTFSNLTQEQHEKLGQVFGHYYKYRQPDPGWQSYYS